MSRFTKLSPEGLALPADAPLDGIAGIRINATGIIVAPFLLSSGDATWSDAKAHASKCDYQGHAWRLPEVEEAFHIPDRTRFNPAVDPQYFPFLVDTDPRWIWTNTADASDPESFAWYVFLLYGHSGIYPQYGEGLVLAVRGPVPSAGQ